MNPSPDRKECLPPKKRESRHGSAAEPPHAPADDFKPPVPLRTRPSAAAAAAAARGEGSRDPLKHGRHLLASPPPLPLPLHLPGVPLPWHVHYPPPLPLFPGHAGAGGESRGCGSPSWGRDDPLLPSPLSSPLSNHSRWSRGESVLPLAPAPFKTPYAGDARDMWSYLGGGQRDYSPAPFSSQLFSHAPLLTPDPGLAEARDRYLVKRPNGVDGPCGRASRLPLLGDYASVSPQGGPAHANGGRRQQEELPGRASTSSSAMGGGFFPGGPPQETHEMHSSPQDPCLTPKASAGPLNHLGPDPRGPERGGGLLEALGGAGAASEAQIYYSLGPVQAQAPAFPFYGPPEPAPYGPPPKDPGARPHGHLFSHRLPSNHDRSQREAEREAPPTIRHRQHRAPDGERTARESEAARASERERKEEERDEEPERRRSRERDRARAAPGPPQPPAPGAFLPHFTKGSLIELAGGRLKRVEEMRTEDFLRSADTSPEFHLSTCTVLRIAPANAHGFNHLQVNLNDRNTQELLKVLEEYPFFVRDRGWSSCCPPRTAAQYGLPCRQLAEGDVCLALTPTPSPGQRTHAAAATAGRSGSRSHRTHPSPGAGSGSSPREQMPPPPPPPPLHHHHQHHHHHHPHPHGQPTPAVPALPPPGPALEGPQRPRKRRWSAPDAVELSGRGEGLLDLPQGSKLTKWQ